MSRVATVRKRLRVRRFSSPENRALIKALGPYRRTVALTGCLAAASAILEIAIIAIIAALSSRMISGSAAIPFYLEFNKTQQILIGLAIVVTKVVVDVLYARQFAHSVRSFESGVRRRLSHLLTTSAWSTVEDSESGEIHALLWTTVARCREGFTQVISILTSFTSLLLMLIATVVAAKAMIIAIIGGLVLFGLAFRPLISAAKQTSHDLKDSYLWYGQEISEVIAMGREARVLGIQETLESRLSDAGDASADAVAKQTYFSSMMRSGYMNAIYVLAVISLSFLAGMRISNPAPLAATVLLLYRSMTYGQSLQSGLQNIAMTSPFFSELDRWIDKLSSKEDDNGRGEKLSEFRQVEFRDAGLRYPNDHIGISHLTTSIARGESLAVIGPSGSGKSSFVSLLLGLRDHTSGSIRINGLPFDQLDRRSWMGTLALVSQDCILFDATVEENVRAWRDISQERVISALRQANVYDEIVAMERGLGTHVGERGKRLSGGQRQRIALARALAGEPELLILDEPTSALDPGSEQAVRESLLALKGEVTLVIIAHRMSTISICERVLVLERGRLRHDGTPASTVRESEFFSRAVDLSAGTQSTMDPPNSLG